MRNNYEGTKPRDWYLNNVTVVEPPRYLTNVGFSRMDSVVEERRTPEGRARLRDLGYDVKDSSSRAFASWDGEGMNIDGPNKAQAYCLFGCSTGDYISSRAGLSSRQCFQLLLRVKYKYPDVIHTGFSIGYDCEMMFRDIPWDIIRAITNGQVRWWGRYRIHYINKKWLQIGGPYRGKRVSIRLFDIWSYFGCSFLDALRTFLPNTNEHTMRRIVEGKKARGVFELSQLETLVIPYWKEELECGVKLITKLRELLNKAGLYPNSWHGPATLANYLNKKHGIATHMNYDAPELVKDATQFAYAAGMVENYAIGRLCGPAYKYDRNSAYPSAMIELPSLSGKKWKGSTFKNWRDNAESDYRVLGIQPFGMYYVDYNFYPFRGTRAAFTDPQPFFHRTRQSNIQFPTSTKRWVWGVELMTPLLMNKFSVDRPVIRVYRGLELDSYDAVRPYAFVADMYNTRLAMKRAGLEEQMAIKLGLNSLYGKMAQQKGYREQDAGERPWFKQMPWHQLDWAGFVTAHNRTRIYEAAMLAAERGILISVETDAIFTSAPMPELGNSDKLGEWGCEKFDDIIYLQSGVYLTYHKDGCKRGNCNGWHLKYRGFDQDSTSVNAVLRYLESVSLFHCDPERYKTDALVASTTRFIGFKLANARSFGIEDDWRVWKTEPRNISVGDSGKRIHNPEFCRACLHGNYFGAEALHDMSLKNYTDFNPVSYATPLPWRTVKRQADKWLPENEEDFDIDGIDL